MVSPAVDDVHGEALLAICFNEVVHYNALVATVFASIDHIVNALEGASDMTTELKVVCDSLLAGAVPAIWTRECYPCSLQLEPWFENLVSRLRFVEGWATHVVAAAEGPSAEPQTELREIWVGGLYFPEALGPGLLRKGNCWNHILSFILLSSNDYGSMIYVQFSQPTAAPRTK